MFSLVTTRKFSSSMVMLLELDLTRILDSPLKTEPKTSEESLRSPSSSLSLDKLFSSLSSHHTEKTETSPSKSTTTLESHSTNATSLLPSKFARRETSRDFTRRPELESSHTSLVSLTHMKNQRPQPSMSTLESKLLTSLPTKS